MLDPVEDVVADALLVAELQELPALRLEGVAPQPLRQLERGVRRPLTLETLEGAHALNVLLPHAVDLVGLEVPLVHRAVEVVEGRLREREARVALAGMSREAAEVLPTSALDVQKFDMSVYESDPATRV